MKGLSKKKEYLGTFLNSHAPSENGQHLVQGLFGEDDCDINTLGLRFAHG